MKDDEPAVLFEQVTGTTPLLLNVPHAGTELPESVRIRLRPEAMTLGDTDWHMDRIARDVLPEGASLLCAKQSRYLVDLNRPADDKPLYETATTGLISTINFDGEPLYLDGTEPDVTERAYRIRQFWRPYHAALEGEIARIKAIHGFCVLLDVHSIRSEISRLFEGMLPDLNLGTNSGASAAPELVTAAFAVLEGGSYSSVCDGRFKGGYITRRYGQPENGVHALQIEISQKTYMREAYPWLYYPEQADLLKETLSEFVAVLANYTPQKQDAIQ